MQFQNRQRFSWAFVFGLVLWMFATDVAKASTFEAGVLQFNFSTGTCFPSLGSSPASGSWSTSVGGSGTSSASAIAAGGTLRGLAIADSLGNVLNVNNQIGACFRVETVIDDIIISGPGSTVSTQVSADLSGTFASMLNVGGLSAGGLTTASVQAVSLSPVTVSGNITSSVDTTLTTAVFSAPVNQAFAVRLILSGRAIASAGQGPGGLPPGTASISNDFGGTLNFAEGTPVFALPAGYTANSLDGEIVDNQFVGNAAPPVPALGGPFFAVLVSLLLALGVRRLAAG